MDNASNNDQTFMGTLERELRRRGIKFHAIERRVRYDIVLCSVPVDML